MMYDTDDTRILAGSVAVRSTETETLTVKIDCLDGYQLSAHTVADCVVEARHDGDAWVNIETTPIDLTPWDGDREIFEIRVTAPTITSQLIRQCTFSVGRA